MTLSITEAFQQYLQRGAAAPSETAALVQALQRGGFGLEARLLSIYGERGAVVGEVPDGLWAGRAVHAGPRPPAQPQAGELWFDTCELVTMILIPRDDVAQLSAANLARVTPYVGWMSLRPVAQWQLAAFLSLARYENVRHAPAPRLSWLDAKRLLDGDETRSATNLTCGEAGLYARWFGKGMPNPYFWECAAVALPELPWGSPAHEWAGISRFDEDENVVVSPETYFLDPRDEADAGGPSEPGLRMLYPVGTAQPHVTFRTAINSQIGLEVSQVASDPGGSPVRLLDRFSRPE